MRDAPVERVVAVTWNIQHARRADGDRPDPEALAATCASFGADVLALQEVDRRTARLAGVDLLDVVADATGLTPIDGHTVAVAGGTYGNALLVRGPVDDIARFELPPSAAPGEVRSMVRCRWRGAVLACCHLDHRGEAATQLGAVLARLDGEGPAVVLGDLNLGPPAVAAALGAVAPEWVAVEVPAAFPAASPARRIDHVLTREAQGAARPGGRRPPVSDHRPVVVDLAWGSRGSG